MAVRRAREAHVPEVRRVVARLLERLQHQRRERLAPAAGSLDVIGHELAGGTGDRRSVGRPHPLRRRRGRDAEIGEPGQQQ